MTTLNLHDDEFGTIAVRCNPRAKRAILRMGHNGEILLTIPGRLHLPLAKRLLNDNREHLRQQRAQRASEPLQPGQIIGKHHELIFQARPVANVSGRVTQDKVIVTFPIENDIQSDAVQAAIQPVVKKAIRRQAESYLPTRIEQLSRFYQLPFSDLRLSSGRTRWGSCSSDNSISLNIWLMTLPYELIDYVICHELCHTVHHNHSTAFWQLVAAHMPDYKVMRKLIKEHRPQQAGA